MSRCRQPRMRRGTRRHPRGSRTCRIGRPPPRASGSRRCVSPGPALRPVRSTCCRHAWPIHCAATLPISACAVLPERRPPAARHRVRVSLTRRIYVALASGAMPWAPQDIHYIEIGARFETGFVKTRGRGPRPGRAPAPRLPFRSAASRDAHCRSRSFAQFRSFAKAVLIGYQLLHRRRSRHSGDPIRGAHAFGQGGRNSAFHEFGVIGRFAVKMTRDWDEQSPTTRGCVFTAHDARDDLRQGGSWGCPGLWPGRDLALNMACQNDVAVAWTAF